MTGASAAAPAAQPKRLWIITCTVEGKNPGSAKPRSAVGRAKDKLSGDEQGINEGGFIIQLTNGEGTPQEVGRVAFIRKSSNQPRKSFKAALDEMVGTANIAMQALNQQEQIVADLLAKCKPGELS